MATSTLKGKFYAVSSNFATKTVPTATTTNIGSVTLDPGRYIIIFYGRFATNANGRREMAITNSDSSLTAGYDCWLNFHPSPTDNTANQVVLIHQFTEQTTLYFNVRQYSGTDLTFGRGRYEVAEL